MSSSNDIALKLNGLVKKYPEFTLGPIDLELMPGTVAGLVGPNSSGKTTTINSIAGLIRYEGGGVEIFGTGNNLNDPSWKYDIGYVGDQHVFYENWSCKANLDLIGEFYPDWDNDVVKKLAERFDLDLKKRARTLSTGNRAKLALISVLAHNPKLLILDEPTSGLDPVVRSEFLDVLFEYMEKGNAAILYSTHILSDISRIADDLIFIDQGKIVLRTHKDDLIDKWRKISFTYDGGIDEIRSIVKVKSEGKSHLVLSYNHTDTLDCLGEMGISNPEVSLMTVDEIAVQILKEGSHVEDN